MSKGDEKVALAHELGGAFSDLAWALAADPHPSLRSLPAVALIPAMDSELARQRLLLSGYAPEPAIKKGYVPWRSAAGLTVMVAESNAAWLSQAFQAANRNRSPSGTPILTLAYEVLLRLQDNRPEDEAAIRDLLKALPAEEVKSLRKSILSIEPDAMADLDGAGGLEEQK